MIKTTLFTAHLKSKRVKNEWSFINFLYIGPLKSYTNIHTQTYSETGQHAVTKIKQTHLFSLSKTHKHMTKLTQTDIHTHRHKKHTDTCRHTYLQNNAKCRTLS